MPTLPLTSLEDRALAADLDNHVFSLTFAQPVAVKDLMLLIVRGTSLSIAPDPEIGGSFIGELKNVTVRQALAQILPPLGLDYAIDGSFIHVSRRQPETRLFDVNYIATNRSADSVIGTAGMLRDAPFSRVSSATSTDVWGDLARGVQSLLGEHATFNLDRKAGLLQVTDFPERLDRIALYLDTVHDRVHRQVQIDARIVEVELSDQSAHALDWSALSQARDLTKALAALDAQGKVTTLASPRLSAMNNEPAIVKTDGFTLSVTPQIAADSVIMLSMTPIVSAPGNNASDMLARVPDGQTIVVSGLSREREVKETKNAGSKGGWFGRATVLTKKHVELVILLTPRVLTPLASS
jgi:type II secretory pathway component HofQ